MDWSEVFGEVTLTPDAWPRALSLLAAQTRSDHARLVGLTATGTVAFNWLSEGGSASSAPNGAEAPVPDQASEPSTGSWCRDEGGGPWPFSCHAVVWADPGYRIVLALRRSRADGPADAIVRAEFAAAAAAAGRAVRLSASLAGQGAALLLGALERLTRPAFLLDGTGRVCARSPGTDAVLEAGQVILRNRRLHAGGRGDDLGIAVAAMLASSDARRTLGLDPLFSLELLALPGQPFDLGFAPNTVVSVREAPVQLARKTLIERFGFTTAEAEIVYHLANGVSRQLIATRRNVSIDTVRAQIKSIYQKLHCKREAELLVKVRPFMATGG